MMKAAVVEKRRYKRIFFSSTDRIVATFALSDRPEELVRANVMNLSEGGLFNAIHKGDRFEQYNKGLLLTLTKIEGTSPPSY